MAAAAAFALAAASGEQLVLSADKPGLIYRCGEKTKLRFSIKKDGTELKSGLLLFSIEEAPGVRKVSKFDLASGSPVVIQTERKKPGFNRFRVYYSPAGGKLRLIKQLAVAFDPEKLTVTTPEPADLMKFWRDEVKKYAKMPLDFKKEALPKFSRKGAWQAWKVSFAAPQGRVYGFLCIPEKKKPLPADVTVCYAGPGFTRPELSRDRIVLALNIHKYDPANSAKAYAELNKGPLLNPKLSTKYMYHGLKKRDSLYYHHGIIGCIRAVEFLTAMPETDSANICYYGTSQGGGIGLILAALTGKFKAAALNVPAMCNQFSEYPGWPFYKYTKPECASQKEIAAVVPYYDPALFARYIKCPVYVTAGFRDELATPESVYAMFNALPNPGALIPDADGAHATRKGFSDNIKKMHNAPSLPKAK